MSPPIRDGSGNSIGSIRLGDGSEIAEVRTGAGDVVFSAIPDSGGAHQWTTDAGSGTTLEDTGTSSTPLDGSINGPDWITGGKGVGDAYLDYDASQNEYVELGTDSKSELSHIVNNGAGTFAFWINPDDTTRRTVIANGFDGGSNHFCLRIKSGSLDWFMTASNGSFEFRVTAGTITTNSWQLVVGVADGSSATAYVADTSDNQVTAVGTDTSTINTNANNLTDNVNIGRTTDGAQDHFNGEIDIGFTDTTSFTKSELDQWLNNTKQFYQ